MGVALLKTNLYSIQSPIRARKQHTYKQISNKLKLTLAPLFSTLLVLTVKQQPSITTPSPATTVATTELEDDDDLEEFEGDIEADLESEEASTSLKVKPTSSNKATKGAKETTKRNPPSRRPVKGQNNNNNNNKNDRGERHTRNHGQMTKDTILYTVHGCLPMTYSKYKTWKTGKFDNP